jgi:hypothetical protein
MRVQSTTRYAALAALVGALACAGNKARTEETGQPNERAAARDTTSGRDTLNGKTENPPGYRGMERDTTQVPPTGQTPTDTFLQNQGQRRAQDTAGYSGMERVDTTTGHHQMDTTGYRQGQIDTTGYRRDSTGAGGVRDTSGAAGVDTTRNNQSSSNPGGLDSTAMSKTGDTTGYSPSQQSRDSTAR